ncbi:hypothetical protein LIER_32475 [Lithospermum erythrorhizon]|uniref:Uncharacterized protein n=1 Tax=Lithospermum erythrorhizon TaxID=34254 RepID=A0AAV3RXT8_LITER
MSLLHVVLGEIESSSSFVSMFCLNHFVLVTEPYRSALVQNDSIVDTIEIQELPNPGVEVHPFAALEEIENGEQSKGRGTGNGGKQKGKSKMKDGGTTHKQSQKTVILPRYSVNTQQHIFGKVKSIGSGDEFMLSVVYGSNCNEERKQLWNSLRDTSSLVGGGA